MVLSCAGATLKGEYPGGYNTVPIRLRFCSDAVRDFLNNRLRSKERQFNNTQKKLDQLTQELVVQQTKEIKHELKELLISLNCTIASEKMKQKNLSGIQPDREPDLSMALSNNVSLYNVITYCTAGFSSGQFFAAN